MEATTSSYDLANFLFPHFDNSTKLGFYAFLLFMDDAAHPLLQVQLYICIIGVIITIFHLVILTRKGMVTSSVISIMIGIAVCDWISMMTLIESNSKFLDVKGTDCTPPISLLSFRTYWISSIIRDFTRRASTWLGLLMALFRYLALKFATATGFQQLSESLFGYYTVLGTLLLSSAFSIFYYFRFDLFQESVWTPLNNCTNIDLTVSYPVYGQKQSDLFSFNDGAVGKAYMFINGMLSKIIPCILLPLLTLLLILELRRADKVRQTVNFLKRVTPGTEKTTALVIFMAVLFFIVELPIGITVACQVAYTDVGYWWLATYVQHFCNTLFAVSTSIHCFICFLMSSQYRKTVSKIYTKEKIITSAVNSY